MQTITINNEQYFIKKETDTLYVYWLNEPFYTKFDTLVDIGIISKHNI